METNKNLLRERMVEYARTHPAPQVQQTKVDSSIYHEPAAHIQDHNSKAQRSNIGKYALAFLAGAGIIYSLIRIKTNNETKDRINNTKVIAETNIKNTEVTLTRLKSLEEIYGKNVVVTFWPTEIKGYDKLYKIKYKGQFREIARKYSGKGVYFLDVRLNEDNKKTIEELVREGVLSYDITRTPCTKLIKDGKEIIGYVKISPSKLENLIQEYYSEQAQEKYQEDEIF